MPKVFISYSHDSPEHSQRVLDLSNQLRTGGVDCDIDQYTPTPDEGWPLWMLRHMQDADHVILVCTETYQKRVEQREEKGKGAGVKWEGMLVLNQLYRNESRNIKFVPIVFASTDKAFIPDAIFGFSYFDLSEPHGYTRLYQHLWGELAVTKPALGAKQNITLFHSDRLPTVGGGFFGREQELQMLDAAWGKGQTQGSAPTDTSCRGRPPCLPSLAEGETRIIQFIAPGGTGKTKLLRHWIDHTPDIPNLIAWSFYSQGSSENKQTSATPFFTHAFEKLGSTRDKFASEEDKGEHLAELLLGKRCLLVLDGLEPLQHSSPAMRGELKDKAIRQLLRQLARHPDGLCVITTRIAVHDLSDRQEPVVISHDLQNLCEADGVRLLQSLGVSGSQAELGKAVREYGGHALALSLLGNAVRRYLVGDILKRDTIHALNDGNGHTAHHAFKVMQAYETWLANTAELQVLYLLGLFDHPIERHILHVLTQEESLQAWKVRLQITLANKTRGMGWWKRIKTRFQLAMQAANANNAFNEFVSPIRKLDDAQQQQLLVNLHELGLLYTNKNNPELLDCHPLIREYFGGQLQAQQPKGWRQAHERLYEYYKALPDKELPDTLEEMQPLFSAVAHGCAAGLHQQALEEVYWLRIQREDEYYCVNKLGAFSDDLATISYFFTAPWFTPAAGLTETYQAVVLNWAGAWLRALGRLREALEPMQATIEMLVKQEDWKNAALNASNLSELQLTLGEVAAARESGQRSVDYADQSGELFQRMSKRTTHADALHQAGEAEAALALFREAEQLQQERQPEYPRLYSVQGFRYCDLLLAQGGTAEVLERAEQTIKYAKEGWYSLLDIALNQLTLGRAHFQKAVEETPPSLPLSGEEQEQAAGRFLSEAEGWLEQAVAGLRAAGVQDYLIRGLLARATLHRATGDFARARQDLQEVFDIAEPSGMRLHLTDWHLEMARRLLTPPSPTLPPQGGQGAGAAAQPSVGATLPPSPLAGEGRDGGNSSEAAYHIREAERLIHATGYHRRDPELAELQQAISAIPQ